MEVKQPKTYEEQVQCIKNKGFLIEDKNSCIEFLKKTNYYRLSAYFLPFKKKDGTYFENISFKRVQRIGIYRLKSALFSVFQCTPIRYRSASVSG